MLVLPGHETDVVAIFEIADDGHVELPAVQCLVLRGEARRKRPVENQDCFHYALISVNRLMTRSPVSPLFSG